MTDIALFTTSIGDCRVLRQYRASDPDVLMIIAGDIKTPHDEVRALCQELGNAVYLDLHEQDRLGYQCSDIIGPRSIQRRNIALLEAIRSGADVVLSVDDDNAPAHEWYFQGLHQSLAGPQGERDSGAGGWFNLGDRSIPDYYYRGFPFSLRPTAAAPEPEPVDAGACRVGVVNGLIYGDPDINAIDRYPGGGPRVTGYYLGEQDSIPLNGIYVNPRTTWTPINSQNTAYVRELAPLAFVLPGIGRYDDIWASFMALRVMEATDYHVLFGEPSVIQERNPHNWLIDLEKEMYGMMHTEAFCAGLKATAINPQGSVLDNLAAVAQGAALLPTQARLFLNAWLDDVGKVI